MDGLKADGNYPVIAYDLARQNTKYNKNRAVISKEDEWVEEGEWDILFALLHPSCVSE